MGLWPTRGNKHQRRPREGGDPLSVQWIPACAGMTRLSGEYPWACSPPEWMKIGSRRHCTIGAAWKGEGRLRLWMS